MIPLLSDYQKARNVIETNLGGIVDGRFIFCGLDVNKEIAGSMTQTEVLLLWLLGRKPEPMETRLMDALITINTYPDIRIWCIRAGAYAAAAGAPEYSAFGAAATALNARLFGAQAALAFRRFLTDIAHRLDNESLESIIDEMVSKKAFFPGFGRPLIQGKDERIERMKKLLHEWRYPIGRNCSLLFSMADLIFSKTSLHPNYAALFVAIFMDPPFMLDDEKILAAGLFITNLAIIGPVCESAGMSWKKPLLPQSIADVEYRGVRERELQGKGTTK
jgi:hypothetical protein